MELLSSNRLNLPDLSSGVDPAQLQLLGVDFMGINVSTLGTVALIVIMTTMGLGLQLTNFRRVTAQPLAVWTGILGQLVLLPLLAFILVWLFAPPLPIAMGLIILACCPGGATSNFFTFLARGDVALSIVLTAISGVVVVFSAPLLIELALRLFAGEAAEIHLPVIASMLRIFALVVLPVILGMSLRRMAPALADRVHPWATRLSFAVIVFTMVVLLGYIAPSFPQMLTLALPITATLNVVMMLVGFGLARALLLSENYSRCISIEIGIQNYTLSVVIALALLKRPDFAIVPIVYLFTMYVSVFSFIAWCRFWRDRSRAATATGAM